VASLLPSATELVAAVGGTHLLVGRSHECDFPPGVETLPVLTRPRVSLEGPSGEIDRRVRAALERALTVYEVEVDALERVRADVVVTQDLCDVCAVSRADVERALAELGGGAGEGPTLVSLHPTRLADVFDDLERVGRALHRPEEARLARRDLEERVATIAERAAEAQRLRGGERPRVLTVEWIDPVMVGGTWMPELVLLAGGEPLVTEPGQHAPTLSREALAALDPAPDAVLVKPCGFDLARTRAEYAGLGELLAAMPWPAVRAGRVWVADGNAYFNRPGPRLVESLEILAACLDPETFADFAQRHRESFETFKP
jgi:iron complex transport system substrate-binding protein